MNRCESQVRAIKRACSLEIPSSDTLITAAWDLPARYADMQATVTANANITNVEGTPEQLYANSNVTYGWRGLILADNDCIYSVPNNGTFIHKIDCATNAVTTISLGEAGHCFRGCFAKDRKIYMPPYSASYKLRVLDTTTDTVSNIVLSATGFAGSFCTSDGAVFNHPGNGSSSSWYVYNTKTGESLTSFNGMWGGGGSRFYAVILNDKLVAPPYNGSNGFYFWDSMPNWSNITDPNYVQPKHTKSTSYYRYTNYVVSADGKVYNIPSEGNAMVILDPLTEGLSSARVAFFGYCGTLGYDNSLYLAYRTNSYNGVGKYNISTKTVTTLTPNISSTYSRVTGMALWNDKLFYQEETGAVYVIPLNIIQPFKPATLLSPLMNRP